jgi:hypothetical protein
VTNLATLCESPDALQLDRRSLRSQRWIDCRWQRVEEMTSCGRSRSSSFNRCTALAGFTAFRVSAGTDQKVGKGNTSCWN